MSQPNRRQVLQYGTFTATGLAFPNFSNAQPAPIKIGLVTPLSGSQEFIGIFVKNGAEVAVDQINKAGGVLGRPLQLEIRDDKATRSPKTEQHSVTALGVDDTPAVESLTGQGKVTAPPRQPWCCRHPVRAQCHPP